MRRSDTPRRKRAHAKAWVYLALFGAGADTADPTSDAGRSGDPNDGDTPDE
jgi:hypothetical protein